MLAIKEETFEGTLPFPPQYYTSNGFAMHFVDVGSGEPIVMLHGDPTWGYLYRHFIPPLAHRYRCIVPDHMGMGKSDVPQARSLYCLEQHIANLEVLLLLAKRPSSSSGECGTQCFHPQFFSSGNTSILMQQHTS